MKPLKFEESPEDSPLKTELIKRINAKNLSYADIYNYCTNIKGGDIVEGQRLGYNLISGLKNRHSMIDSTFALWADFIGLDIILVERAPLESTEEDENDDI